jgi:hypothetical protein
MQFHISQDCSRSCPGGGSQKTWVFLTVPFMSSLWTFCKGSSLGNSFHKLQGSSCISRNNADSPLFCLDRMIATATRHSRTVGTTTMQQKPIYLSVEPGETRAAPSTITHMSQVAAVGKRFLPKKVFLNKNLYEASFHLRSSENHIKMWVDAIYIA